jgi:hypothetical protein
MAEGNESDKREREIAAAQQAYLSELQVHHTYEARKAIEELQATEAERLRDERRRRDEEQRAEWRRAGLPGFSQSFQDEWLRLTRLLERFRAEAGQRDRQLGETAATLTGLREKLSRAEQRLRDKVGDSVDRDGPITPLLVKVAPSFQGRPHREPLAAARAELQSAGALGVPGEHGDTLVGLVRDIDACRKAPDSFAVAAGPGSRSGLTITGILIWCFLLVELVGSLIQSRGDLSHISWGVALVIFSVGAIFFLPAYFRSIRIAKRKTKLSSLQRWASACEELLVGLDLPRPSRLPAGLTATIALDCLANCRSAIIDHLTSRVVASLDDPDAAEVVARRAEIATLQQRDHADRDAWDSAAPQRAATEQRWDYLRGDLERVGREIVAGHRLPGAQIELLPCPGCGTFITSESTACYNCGRQIAGGE